MAQFDVHANTGRQRSHVPYLLVLQNARFDRIPTRLVAALVVPTSHVFDDEHHLTPRFAVQGRVVVLSVFELMTLRSARLGPWVTRLDDDQSRAKIQRALDELLSQA